MAPTSFEFPAFGGLDVRDDGQEVGTSAVDMRNILLDTPGVLRTRDGLTSIATVSAGMAGLFSWPLPTQTNDLLVTPSGSNISVYGADGSLKGSTATTSTYTDFTPVAAGGLAGYLARGAASSVQKIDFFGVLTTPAAMPNASFLTVQSPDNRLVAGDVSVGGARVRFSDPAAPETFGTNNWVDLEPYDGDQLTSLVSWNNFVFAFKSNKIFCFYGNDVDGTGQPIFNVRRISASVGAVPVSGSFRSAVATPEGVYFVHKTGVYRTSGGVPQKVSSQLDPLFRGQALPPYYTGVSGSSFTPYSGGITRVGNRIVLRGSSSEWLVYDLDQNLWMYWSMPGPYANYAVPAVGVDAGYPVERLYVASNTALQRMTPNATTDNGTAITARYRMGFWNPGKPGSETWMREMLIDGSGAVTVKQSTNDATTLGSGQALTLGTSPAIGRARDRRGIRGRNFSFEFSGTAPWQISRVEPIVWSQRSPGEQA